MKENRKIVITRLGHSFRDCTEVVAEPLAPPGPQQVLIRNRFAGVNGVYDQMMCANKVAHTLVVPPADAGVEALGVVEDVGADVDEVTVGDAVLTVGAGGGYRNFRLCKATDVIAVPDPSAEILALIPSGVSALLALERTGEMRSDEVVCITAAAGGLGNIATQLAIRAGNHVIAVCGSDEKARWLNKIGAARVVQYRRESLADVLASEYPERIDLAIDSVGADIFDALLENLAPHARLVVCGATADRLPPVKCLQERVYTRLYWKAASVRGFMNYRFPEYAADARHRLLKMLEDDEIRPLIDAVPFTGLDEVADAVEHLLAGKNLGKVIVELDH